MRQSDVFHENWTGSEFLCERRTQKNICYPNQEFKIEFGFISEVPAQDFKEKNWLNSTEISNFKRVVGAIAAMNIYIELQCSTSK